MNDNVIPFGQPTDNTPHDVQPISDAMNRENATEIAPGVLLATLDGSKMGNGIVIKEISPHPSAAKYLAATNQKMWLIQTDFGNICRLSDNEIHEFYGLSWQSDYDEWWDARLALIKDTVDY